MTPQGSPMPILPVRDLAKFGVITDVDPYNLPVGAWSFAKNLRFADTTIHRGPVWRKVAAQGSTDARFLVGNVDASGEQQVFIGYKDGTVVLWASTGETDYTLSGYTPASSEATWTSCRLADVVYINRNDRTPWGLIPAATAFTEITGWDSGWSAKLLRAYNSALVALNVTKSGTTYPTLVKTSDIVTTSGGFPASWDHTDTSTNAVENPLTEMKSPIVDAAVLGDALIIYGAAEAHVMRADGGDNVYTFRRLPFDKGAINANCAIEVDGKHYVFGPDDLWVHDGLNYQSICEGKVRKFVFSTLNASKSARFFVSYNPNNKCVSFNYLSGDAHVEFEGVGCNRAAVFNTVDGQWTFDDLPLVHASTLASVSLDSLTWTNTTASWNTAGGSWQDLEDGFKRAPLYVGDADTASGLTGSLYAQDEFGDNSLVSADVDEIATTGAELERDGIDLDELGEELTGYKHILAIYPQARLDAAAEAVEFSWGSADNYGEDPLFTAAQTFNGRDLSRCDYTNGGRYLSMRMNYPDYKTFVLSAFDLDVEVTGYR